jgi:hypothetical protein
MANVSEYWFVSFDQERVSKTITELLNAAQRCDFEKTFIDKIDARIKGSCKPLIDNENSWLFSSLTEMLVSESTLSEIDNLDITLQRKLEKVWVECNPDEINFTTLCLNSNSIWDQYIRSITPDIPTMLVDYVSIEIVERDRFAFFWDRICKTINNTQKTHLIAWYASAFQAVTEQEFIPPEWMK